MVLRLVQYANILDVSATLGPIGWSSVRQSVMDIWGLGSRSRSVLYSVWQLLFRPGYFISDYISGKRQVSFPPIRMLFILAVAYAIIFLWLFPDLKGLGYGLDFSVFGFTADEGINMTKMSKPFYDWYETHFGWSMLILSFFLIFPTWVMFRYSPRHTRHSLPARPDGKTPKSLPYTLWAKPRCCVSMICGAFAVLSLGLLCIDYSGVVFK